MIHKGDTIYGIVRSVARSGMSRTIDFYVIKDGAPIYLTAFVAETLGMKRNKEGALKVSGTGMDMVFAVVYDLGRKLFDDGSALAHGQL